MLRTYRVRVWESSQREFLTDANSPEEAESIVEQMREDGDEGKVLESHIEMSEAIPVDLVDDGYMIDDTEVYA